MHFTQNALSKLWQISIMQYTPYNFLSLSTIISLSTINIIINDKIRFGCCYPWSWVRLPSHVGKMFTYNGFLASSLPRTSYRIHARSVGIRTQNLLWSKCCLCRYSLSMSFSTLHRDLIFHPRDPTRYMISWTKCPAGNPASTMRYLGAASGPGRLPKRSWRGSWP